MSDDKITTFGNLEFPEGTLESNTTYIWRVDTVNSLNETVEGPTWEFTTGLKNEDLEAINPDPGNLITAIIDTDLSWTNGEYTDHIEVFLKIGDSNIWDNSNIIYSGPVLDRIEDYFFEYEIVYNWGVRSYSAIEFDRVVDSEVWEFTTQTQMTAASNPIPVVGDLENITLDKLSWNLGLGFEHFNVYIGKSPILTEDDLFGSVQDLTIDISAFDLDYDSTYYWRIDNVNDPLIIHGDIWSFNTAHDTRLPEQVFGISPVNNANEITVDTFISWEETLFTNYCKIYFGTTQNLTVGDYKGDQTSRYFELKNLIPNKIYYWRIDSVNENGTTTGFINSFLTSVKTSKVIRRKPDAPEAIYLDFDFNFENNLDYGVNYILDEKSINQSIRNILLTKKGEVPFDPLFGSDVSQLLFEKISPVTEAILEDEIVTALTNYEPRIKIIDITCNGDPDNHVYNVRLEYLIIFLSISTVLEFSLDLKGL